MSDVDLATLERRMEQRWREFAFADVFDNSEAQLERLYDRYLDARDAYMRAKREVEQTVKTSQK